MTMNISVLLVLCCCFSSHALAFYVAVPRKPAYGWRLKLAATNGDAIDSDLLEELRSLTTRQLKDQLSAKLIKTDDVFEKEQLVQRLYENRKSSTSTTTTKTREKSSEEPVVVPLFLTSGRDLVRRLATVNGEELIIHPSEQQFATVQMEVCETKTEKSFSLSLLLDTACSGFVLRPTVTRDLPLLSTPVTMTGAGGTETATVGLTQIDSFRFGEATFGPLPAAVEAIDALPPSLDGILGLSFLSQFACVEMDFRQGRLRLYKTDPQPPVPDGVCVVADADMILLGSLGIYAVNVQLGRRGPVKMLVDTGAAGTLLNWKGVSDLSLARDSPQVKALPSLIAAMGSDNVALQLTHRICVSSSLNLLGRGKSAQSSNSGLPLDKARLCIDIGDIPILDLLKKEQIGGIMGIDTLSRCAMIRMNFSGRAPRIILFDKV